MLNRKGEISTIVILGTLVVIGVATLIGSTVTQQKKTTDTQAAGSCPITNIEISGATCKVTINFTPGDPEPASPRNLVCALINPARDSGTANNQLIAGQGINEGLDFFNRSNVGQFPLKPEADFDSKLNPVPNDTQYNLVAYDFTNPEGCLKEIKVSADAARAVKNSSEQGNNSTPVPTKAQENQTNDPPTSTPTTKPQSTNTPTPVKICSEPLIKCPNQNLCVPALVECPDVTNTPTQNPTPTTAKLSNGLPIPPLPSIGGPTINPTTPTPTQFQLFFPAINSQNPTPVPTAAVNSRVNEVKTQIDIILKSCQQGPTFEFTDMTSDCIADSADAINTINSLLNNK